MYEVLLVDDEALVRDAISTNMKWGELGYHLAGTCKNGKEAMEFLDGSPVDLVITDICMPFVDGLSLSRHIYENHAETKVILLSGYNEFEYAKTAVKYQVMEYVLKPVTVAELNEILLRVKETLCEERRKKDSLKKLVLAYQKNLPILRTRYLNQLVQGIHKGQSEIMIHNKLKELNIDVTGQVFIIAILVVENTEEFLKLTPEATKELPAFIIFNILEEIACQDADTLVFQDINNATAILLCGLSEAELLSKVNTMYESCRHIVLENFKLGVTLGIGNVVNRLTKVHKSYETALAALEYRFLYGSGRALYIKDFEEMDLVKNMDIGDLVKKLTLAVKLDSEEEITKALTDIAARLRRLVLSPGRIYICVQNIIVALHNLLDNLNLAEDGFPEKQNELLKVLYQKKTLEEVEELLREYCLHIGKILSEHRDSFCKKQAIIAKDYIEEHYGNTELTLQTMCSDLAISMSYFSTIFKRYTGETFIEALTKKRMQISMELLANTTFKVYEIAEKVGFADPHYFAITFKKFTGMTPKEYAKKKGPAHA
jgi:two-component system response regulator YesN